MKNLLIAFSVAFVLLLMSCGEEMDQIKQTVDVVKKSKEVAENYEKNVNVAQERIEARKAKGDTLAMNYKDLQKYLPESISGYTAEEPTGESMQMGMFSFSTASRRYIKDTPEGQDYIEIQITDYNQTQEMFMGVTAAWAAGFKMENDQRMEQSFKTDIENVSGFETYDKVNHNAEVTYAVAWRFIIQANASNQKSTDFMKKIVNDMKIKELSKM
jgi:hypothetical protein